MAQYVTLSTLRSRAREEADMENSSFVADSEANRYVNDAIAELADLLISTEDHPWESRRVALFVPKGFPAIFLPCDFYNLISVHYMPGGVSDASQTFTQASGEYTVTGNPRQKVIMRPFMERERERNYKLDWSESNPPKYRLTAVQPVPGTDPTASYGFTFMSDVSETWPSSPSATEFTQEYWVNSCSGVAITSGGVEPNTYVDWSQIAYPDNAYFGFLLEFDRPPSQHTLLKVHYHVRASVLAADTDGFMDYNGWASFITAAAAIKMRSKEESDTGELRLRKEEAKQRIMTMRRDTGMPQRVVDTENTEVPSLVDPALYRY